MTRLGYARYGAQGGDWGAQVTTGLGIRHAANLIGIHLNMADRAARPGHDGRPDRAGTGRRSPR